MDRLVSQQTMFVWCIIACSFLLASAGAEYAATDGSLLQNPSQYGEVYAIDFENGQNKRSNVVVDDGSRDFSKIPENGLLIIRLLPKSVLEETVLKGVSENGEPKERSKRSPGGGGGCSKCGGGGGGGGYRPGRGGGGGGGSAGAWSSSSSGAWGKG